MREIKFRARGNVFRWLYGDLTRMPVDDFTDLYIVDSEGYSKVADENTIGQFTGLKDKNGVEIYEGDIVKCFGDDICTVLFNETDAAIECAFADNKKYRFYENRVKEIEVIGNIHDNPELLESEK